MKNKRSKPLRGYGASRDSSKQKPIRPGQFLSKMLQWLKNSCLFAALAGGFYFSGLLLIDWINKPVASVKINGEFVRVSKQQVAEKIYASLGTSYMRLDLERIQIQLQRDPWIDTARVERRWPDRLEVTVIEHKPIARWGRTDALNHRGEIIPLAETDTDEAALESLPRLFGEEGMELEVMTQYQAITSLLKEQNLTVVELTCDVTRSWSLSMDNGVLMEIGRDQVMSKIQRFITVFNKKLKPRWNELSRVDLRYFNGLAVQWREAGNA